MRALDSRRVYFTAGTTFELQSVSRPVGQDIFVQPFDRPGDRIQVSRAGGSGAIWRADSRELYYEDNGGLMAVAITERGGVLEAGTPQKLFPLHTQGLVPNQPHNVEVAANGQKFLVDAIVGDSDNAPIEVTLNWTAGLKSEPHLWHASLIKTIRS